MRYHILSLDGGGSWALIEVKFLQRLFGEHAPGHDVLSKFDLVSGNSGGSIVLAALAENLPLSKIAELFEREDIRKAIFHKFSSFYTPFYKLLGLGPRYDTARKGSALNRILPNTASIPLVHLPSAINGKFGKKPDFIIPAFDYSLQRVNFFRSNPASFGTAQRLSGVLEDNGPMLSLTDAAHASSTAPINYFNETAVIAGIPGFFWDGGVAGYNNPVLGAVVEAMVNGIASKNISVLSIGTGSTALPTGDGQSFTHDFLQLKQIAKEGLKNDIRKMARSILDGPPDAASYVALTMLQPRHAIDGLTETAFIRANPQLQPTYKNGSWQLPGGLSADEFCALRALDMDAVKQEEVALISKFCSLWLSGNIPNQPIRTNRNLECLLGQPSIEAVDLLAQKYDLCDLNHFTPI